MSAFCSSRRPRILPFNDRHFPFYLMSYPTVCVFSLSVRVVFSAGYVFAKENACRSRNNSLIPWLWTRVYHIFFERGRKEVSWHCASQYHVSKWPNGPDVSWASLCKFRFVLCSTLYALRQRLIVLCYWVSLEIDYVLVELVDFWHGTG